MLAPLASASGSLKANDWGLTMPTEPDALVTAR
jgi:hypothetical protein